MKISRKVSRFVSPRMMSLPLTALAIAIACNSALLAQNGTILPGLKGGDLTDPEDDGTLNATVSSPFSPPVTPAAEGNDNIADNDVGSKLLVFQRALVGGPAVTDPIPVTVEFNGGASHPVTAYTVTSANDSPERDPYEFTLFGSNNGTDFDQLDFRTGVEFGARFETQVYFLDNSTSYSSYRIDFKTEAGAGGPFGSGDIFQFAELELFDTFAFESLIAIVDRDSGEITLKNDNSTPVTVTAYSVTSAAGALNSDVWTSISGNTDGGSGDGSVDNDPWVRFTETGARGDLSEAEDPSGDGTVLAAGQEISLGNAWIRGPAEDLAVDFLLDDLTALSVPVIYEGNNNNSFALGDLSFDGAIDAADWQAFKDGQGTDFSTIISAAESYTFGDLDSDFDHDLHDFALFEQLYDAAVGPGALQRLILGVPEPATGMLLLAALAFGSASIRRRSTRHATAAVAGVALLCGVLAVAPVEAGVEIGGLIGNDLTDQNGDGTLDVVVTAGGNSPGGEIPAFALDDDAANSKWLSFEPNGTFFQVEFNAAASHAVNSYTITSGNDAPERDPYRWTLSGSNNGVDFTVVDSQDVQTWSNRNIVQQFLVGNTTPYNIYRFDFLTRQGAGVAGAGTPNSIQLNEIELLSLANPNILTLQVDTDSGIGTIRNDSGTAIEIDSYLITSASGSLSASGWNSLEDQDLASFPAGDGSGNGWEEGSNPSSSELAEYFLVGSSTVAASSSVAIGEIFSSQAAGDYNGSGLVDAVDYAIWRDTLGDSVAQGTGADGNGNGVIDTADYDLWRENFGATSGAGVEDFVFEYKEENGNFVFGFVEFVSPSAGAIATPEPSSGLLLFCLLIPLLLVNRTTNFWNEREWTMSYSSRVSLTVVALVAVALIAGNASASILDRDHRLGDDPDENPNPAAAIGDIVGANAVVGDPDSTLDSMGPTGAFIDLGQTGDPTYVDVSTTNRPFASVNSLGVTFNGIDQELRGIGLGNPGQGDDQFTAPLSYQGLFARTMQAYVRPTDSGSALRQDVYFDTEQFGIFIDANDNWGIEYGQPGTISTSLPVEFNEWTHVMHRTTGGIVILYLDGVASRAVQGFFDGNPAPNNGSTDLVIGAGTAGGNFFEGQIDDFSLLISGDNSDETNGADYGPFDLGVDNDFARESLLADGFVDGDVNGDGVVNGDGFGDPASDDVAFFVEHWLDQNVVDGFAIGDLNSRTQLADLNFSGTTNLFDWAILRANHADGDSLNLFAILNGQRVPEPSSACLGLLVAVLFGGRTVRRRS